MKVLPSYGYLPLLVLGLVLLDCIDAGIVWIGNPVKNSNKRVGLSFSNTTFLLKDVVLTEGILFAYSAYYLSNTPIRFQIWRPVLESIDHPLWDQDRESPKYTLIWETRVEPVNWGRRVDTLIGRDLNQPCIGVKTGDRLGVFLEDAPSSLSYVFATLTPQALTHPLAFGESYAVINQTVSFDVLAFPYDFSVAGFVKTGYYDENVPFPDCPIDEIPNVYIDYSYGNSIPGATGSTGPVGATGETGEIGPMGLRGKVGATGPMGPPGKLDIQDINSVMDSWRANDCENNECGFSLTNSKLVMILIAWLILLTVLNLAYIVWACFCRTPKGSLISDNYTNHWIEDSKLPPPEVSVVDEKLPPKDGLDDQWPTKDGD